MIIKYNCTLGQIASSWLLVQWEHIVPIPGTKNEKYLHENNQASFVQIEDEDIKNLNELKYCFSTQGERYNTEGIKVLLELAELVISRCMLITDLSSPVLAQVSYWGNILLLMANN